MKLLHVIDLSCPWLVSVERAVERDCSRDQVFSVEAESVVEASTDPVYAPAVASIPTVSDVSTPTESAVENEDACHRARAPW